MTVKIVQGDLLKMAEEGQFDVIVQGCNCFNAMGSGLAKQIRDKYPGAWEVDQATLKGDYRKLGNWTLSIMLSKCVIINAYTQYMTASFPGQDVFEYTAFDLILQKLFFMWPDRRFGFPLIGAGLAGGDWSRIRQSIEAHAAKHLTTGTVTIVEYRRESP